MTMTKQQVLKLEISTEMYLLILILKVNNIIRFHNEAWRKLVSLLSVIILRQFQYPQRDTQILISIESIRCRHSLKRLSGHISDIFYIAEGNFSKGLGGNFGSNTFIGALKRHKFQRTGENKLV